jgi:hypothetical protein
MKWKNGTLNLNGGDENDNGKGKGHTAELGFKIGIDSGWREKRKPNGWKMKIVVGKLTPQRRKYIHSSIHEWMDGGVRRRRK